MKTMILTLIVMSILLTRFQLLTTHTGGGAAGASDDVLAVPPGNGSGTSRCRKRNRRGKIAAVYARYSTEFQASVDDQIRACREWAEANGYQVPNHLVFADRRETGKRFRRAGLTALKAAIANGEIDCLVLFHSSRLMRKGYRAVQFIEEELVIRVGRVVGAGGREPAESTMMSGNIAEISIPTLLSLLDFERKSGILLLLHGNRAARVFVAEGRIVKAELGEAAATPLERMMQILDWTHGSFEFTSCEVVGSDEIGVGTSTLLLEHARIRDEARHGPG